MATTASMAMMTAPKQSFGRDGAALSAVAAGTAGLHRHPGAVRHRRLVLAAALQHEPADDARLRLVRAVRAAVPERRVLEHGLGLAALRGLTVGVELLLGLGIALLLRRSTWFNNALSIALLLPLMVAPAIASLMWKLMIHPDFGIFSYLLGLFGVHDFRWASAPSSALFTVILVDVWVYTPFIMILLLAGLRSLPRQPFEAAELDGVPASFVFFRITLPMLTPYIITAALFRMLDSLQQFDIVYAMTQGGPGNATLLFPGPGLSRLLQELQCRPLGRHADGAVADRQPALDPVHQALAAPARARPGGQLRWSAHLCLGRVVQGAL